MILHGDALDKLKDLEENWVDLVCTDPPYGYSFMGKDWDKAVPSVEIWKECLRVLKPGAFCFVMSAPRSDVQMHMISNLEQAGFDIGFTPLYHTYASGFPKAQNVHKKLTKDKATRQLEVQELWRTIIHSTSSNWKGQHRPSLSPLLEDLEQGEQCEVALDGRPRKEIQVSKGQRESSVEGWRDLSQTQGIIRQCKVCSLPTGILINGKKRWICYGTQISDGSITWEVVDEDGVRTSHQSQPYGQSFRKPNALCEQCGSQALRTLAGGFAGFQPKPAVEVIIVAMKPLSEKTFVDQALKNGKGITWLDDCRVPTTDEKELKLVQSARTSKTKWSENTIGNSGLAEHDRSDRSHITGRFPANLLVSDDVLNDGRVIKSNVMRKGGSGGGYHFDKSDYDGTYESGGDSGSYSRYFDLDKWAATLPFLIVPKASKSEKNRGLDSFNETTVGDGSPIPIDNAFQRGKTPRKNTHPTCKPLKLMSYLITLGSRPGDIVLDPFCGSGTTCIAAKKLNRDYIGIEREEEYVEIAKARISQEVQGTLL